MGRGDWTDPGDAEMHAARHMAQCRKKCEFLLGCVRHHVEDEARLLSAVADYLTACRRWRIAYDVADEASRKVPAGEPDPRD